MVTIKDIAKKSGYSIGTVSRVLNNRADVSEEARKKIKAVIEKENYYPNTNAQGLKQNQGNAIAAIVVGRGNIFFADLLEKIEVELRDKGEEILVSYIDEKTDQVQEALKLIASFKPKGILFLGGSLHAFKQSFSKISLPSVLLTNDAKNLGFANLSSVTTNDTEGARKGMQYLLDKGHRKIGIIGGSMDHSGAIDLRVKSCLQICEEYGIDFDIESQYIETRYSMKDGYEGTLKLLKNHSDISAIFAQSDSVAVGVLRALKDIQKEVPNDVSVIGYDGISFVEYTIPRLATIQQNTSLLAKRGVEILLLRLNYPYEAEYEYIPFHLIEGESVKEKK
ncbi:MAG: LacI family DNA-binding transcriptional regulator [Solobacterium sp.]|nr:LacI family DNA-binding transcriptional regulator [Solobacterium sp.]